MEPKGASTSSNSVTSTTDMPPQKQTNPLPTAAAQPKPMASSTVPSSFSPKSPPLGCQMDAGILDEYLHSLLLTKFLSSLDPLLETITTNDGNGGSNNRHENLRRTLRIILSSCLPAATIWFTQVQTPATKAMGMRVAMASTSPITSSNNPNSQIRATKLKYILWTAILPLIYQLLKRFVMELQQQIRDDEREQGWRLGRGNHSSSSSNYEDGASEDQEQQQQESFNHHHHQQQLARQRQYLLANTIVQGVEQSLPLLKLGLLLSLLLSPRGSSSLPPQLSMALAGLHFISNHSSMSTTVASGDAHGETNANTSLQGGTAPPRLYVLYAHRRWLYEEALQTLRLLFSPLAVSLQDARRLAQLCLVKIYNRLISSTSMTGRSLGNCNINAANVNDQHCAICGKHPISIPYESDVCSHVFCYTCLWKASAARLNHTNYNNSHRTSHASQRQQQPMELGSGYPCPTCHGLIRSSRPVSLPRYLQQQKQQAELTPTASPSSASSSGEGGKGAASPSKTSSKEIKEQTRLVSETK